MRHSTVFGFRKQLFYEPSRGYACKAVPTLVEDFHPNALMQLHTSRSENRAEGSDYASMVANHLADVFRMDAQFEDNHRLPLNRANLHFFRMVHKCLCDCLQQLLREVERRMHGLLRQCARCSRGKLKERKGGHAEATTLRSDSATNPSGSDNLLSEVCALTSWKYSLGRMPKGTCCHCGCTDEKPCRMAPNPHGPIAGQPAATCTWADRGRICFSLPAPLSKAGLHLTMRSLLLVFGLRPGCGCGLFGARDNRRGRRLRRFVFLSDLDLAT